MVSSCPDSIFRFDFKVSLEFRSKMTRQFGAQSWFSIDASAKRPRLPLPSTRNEFESRIPQTRRTSPGVKMVELKSSTSGLTTSVKFLFITSQPCLSSRWSSSRCRASHCRSLSKSFNKSARKTVSHRPASCKFFLLRFKISHSEFLCRLLNSHLSLQNVDPQP